MYGTLNIDPLLGTALGGRYLLRECIGEGAHWRRYLAEREGRPMLATTISAAQLDGEGIEQWLAICGRIEALDEHVHLGSLLDFGREPDGLLFVIEPGEGWHDLARELELKGAFSRERATAATLELLAGLAALHESGLTHGGICPSLLRVQSGDAGRSTLSLSALGLVLAQAGVNPEARPYAPAERTSSVVADLWAAAQILGQLLTGDTDPQIAAERLELREDLPPAIDACFGRFAGGDGFVSAAEMAALLGGEGDEPRLGRYTLLHRLARGGMGEILLARAEGIEGVEGTSRLCVIKTIRTNLAGDPELVERFLSEARVLASLAHGNIVPVYDVGRIGDTFYIAMEYVSGKDLHALMRRSRQQELPIALPLALFIARELANGLAYAHRPRTTGGVGLVHRDVSPQNTLISYEGEIKLIDFGLALGGHGRPTTREGVVLGKLCYISPEQARAEPLDQRTDIYSLGLVLFEMLTGEPFFNHETVDEVMQHVASPTPELPSARKAGIPPDVDAICKRALAPQREERYEGVAELRDDLAAALARVAPRTNPEQVGELVATLFPDAEEEEERLFSDMSGTLPPLPVIGSEARHAQTAASLLATAPAPVALDSALIALESIATFDVDEGALGSGERVDAGVAGVASTAVAGAARDEVGRLAQARAVTIPQHPLALLSTLEASPTAVPVSVAIPADVSPLARQDDEPVLDPALQAQIEAWQRPERTPITRIALIIVLGVVLLGSAVSYRYFAARQAAQSADHLRLALDKRLAATRPPRDARVFARDASARLDAAKKRTIRPSIKTYCFLEFHGGKRGMRVYVDGMPRGSVPFVSKLPLEAGKSHRIVVRYARYRAIPLKMEQCRPYVVYVIDLERRR